MKISHILSKLDKETAKKVCAALKFEPKLENNTWQSVENYLKKNKGIIIPLGSMEQQGLSGLLGMDSLNVYNLALEAANKLKMLICPVISFGISNIHMAFPGTISLKPQTMESVLLDLLNSLEAHGFKEFFIINGLGGNNKVLEKLIERHTSKLILKDCYLSINSWHNYPLVKAKIKKMFSPNVEGIHQRPSELSLLMYWKNIPKIKPEGNFQPIKSNKYYGLDKDVFKSLYPNGNVGSDPTLASKKKGALIFRTAVKAIVKDIKEKKNVSIKEGQYAMYEGTPYYIRG